MDPQKEQGSELDKMIQEKAVSLFQNFKKDLGDCLSISTFSASHGWFQQFKHHCNQHKIKATGETASADLEVINQILQQLKSIIAEDGSSPQHSFQC